MGRNNDARFASRLGVLAGALAVGALAGCGGGDTVPAPKVAPAALRSEAIDHESCGGSRSDSVDTDGDGKADITRYYDTSGHELCRVVDLNHDGKPDLYEYLDGGGQIRRREYCYDDSGAVNAIEFYEAGKLARREYDISGRRRIDTWDWFDPGEAIDGRTGRPAHPVRRERDTTGEGRIDQWWTWNGDRLTIAFDRDGDGRPDPGASLVVGSDGGALDPSSGAGTAASAPQTSAVDGGAAGGSSDRAGAPAGGGGQP